MPNPYRVSPGMPDWLDTAVSSLATEPTSELNANLHTLLEARLPVLLPGMSEWIYTDPVFTGNVRGITKAHVGLNNVNNTADLNKPVSRSTQAALDLKADAATVALKTEIPTRTSLGVDEVDNTADADKPLSTAQRQYVDTAVNKLTKNIPFGHIGRALGFQTGTSETVDNIAIVAAQKLRGGMTFDIATNALVIPKDGLYMIRIRPYFTGATSNICIVRPLITGGPGEPIEASGLWWSSPKTTGYSDLHDTVEREVPLKAGQKVQLGFLTTLSIWGTNGYNGAWLEAKYIGEFPTD